MGGGRVNSAYPGRSKKENDSASGIDRVQEKDGTTVSPSSRETISRKKAKGSESPLCRL